MEDSNQERMGISANTLQVTLPSGRKVTIRESNGHDEGVLSEMKTNSDEAIPKFISSILQGESKQTYAEVIKWKARDVYYLLLKSRIHSLGNIVEFKHQCQNKDCIKCKRKETVTFEEDLNELDFDFSNPEAKPNTLAPLPYPADASDFRVQLPSNRVVSLLYKTYEMEYLQQQMDKSAANINAPSLIRELTLLGNPPEKIKNFAIFTSREMAEIRKATTTLDKDWNPMSTITCPVCETEYNIPILLVPDFFFPGMI